MYDGGVLSGTEDSVKWLQESIDQTMGTDLTVKSKSDQKLYDGIAGSKTQGALEKAVKDGKTENIHNLYIEKRSKYLKGRSNVDSNPGWFPRVEAFRKKKNQDK